jgi:hypothetical protein
VEKWQQRAAALPTAPLGDIRANRDGCAAHLLAEAESVAGRKVGSQSIDLNREVSRLTVHS